MIKNNSMRFLMSVLLIAILCAVAEFFLPWWMAAVVAFAVSLIIPQHAGRAFLMGFAGVGLCWLIAAMLHDLANDHILATKMAVLFKLPGYGLFLVVIALIGGLVGGLASWTGALIKPHKL